MYYTYFSHEQQNVNISFVTDLNLITTMQAPLTGIQKFEYISVSKL